MSEQITYDKQTMLFHKPQYKFQRDVMFGEKDMPVDMKSISSLFPYPEGFYENPVAHFPDSFVMLTNFMASDYYDLQQLMWVLSPFAMHMAYCDVATVVGESDRFGYIDLKDYADATILCLTGLDFCAGKSQELSFGGMLHSRAVYRRNITICTLSGDVSCFLGNVKAQSVFKNMLSSNFMVL